MPRPLRRPTSLCCDAETGVDASSENHDDVNYLPIGGEILRKCQKYVVSLQMLTQVFERLRQILPGSCLRKSVGVGQLTVWNNGL